MKKLLNHMKRTGQKVKKKIVATLALAMSMVFGITGTAFAASTTTDYSAITSAITSELTVAEVVAVIAAIIGAGMGFVLLWWGARKLLNSMISAFKSGKIKF